MKWISVKDRLPGEASVLVGYNGCDNDYGYPYNFNESIEKAFYSRTSKKWFLDDWDHERYPSKKDNFEIETPTHWMALPPAPPEE